MTRKTVNIICKAGLALSLAAFVLVRIYMLRSMGIRMYGFWEDQIAGILVAVFPLFMWALAKLIFRYECKLPDGLNDFLPFVIYYLVAAAYIYLTCDVLLTYPLGGGRISFEADLVSVTYMLTIALIIILAVSNQYYKGSDISGTLCSVGFFLPTLIIVFFLQPRTMQILDSILHAPASEVDIDGLYKNWFSHRLSMLKLVLTGSPQSISSLRLQMFRPRRCPLAWLRLNHGWRSVLFVGIFIAIMILCSNKLSMSGSKDRFVFNRTLFAVIVTQTLFGIIADMFLMYSSHVGIPALQNFYLSVIPLTLLFCSGKQTGEGIDQTESC